MELSFVLLAATTLNRFLCDRRPPRRTHLSLRMYSGHHVEPLFYITGGHHRSRRPDGGDDAWSEGKNLLYITLLSVTVFCPLNGLSHEVDLAYDDMHGQY